MIFSNSKNRGNYDLTLHLNSEIISQSHEERFLGVILDDRLTFSTHKAAIATKVSRNAGILFRARHMFKLQTLKTLYSSFIQSHLIFCSFIWGTGAKSSLQGIFVAQKKAIRAITYTRLYTKDRVTEMYSYGHTKLLFNSLGLLTVHNLILVQMLSQMHKIYRAVAPVHIRGYFKPQSPPLTTEHPTKHDIMPPRGLDSDNIIPDHNELINHKLYYTIPLTRLAKHKQTIIYQGPLTVASWAIVGMHPPINPIRSRWIRPAPGPLWTLHLLEVPLLDQKELDLGHDKTDLKSSGSAIILFYLAVCQPDHIYTRYVPCISFERSCIFNI